MNIWNILGIEPTTDKKAIRKAYAAKTREIHPEDAPEEFKRLHEAYQAALGYADYVRQVSRSVLKTEEESTPDEGAGQENLRAYFEERQEKVRRQVDVFLKHWNAFRSPYHNQESMDWWKNYLASEEFQDIRFQSKVLEVLADEIDDKCFYGIDEVKMLSEILFWQPLL